jgi:hypothetical protein
MISAAVRQAAIRSTRQIATATGKMSVNIALGARLGSIERAFLT